MHYVKSYLHYILLGISLALFAYTAYQVGAISRAQDRAIEANIQNLNVFASTINQKASREDVRLLCSLTPACVHLVQSQTKK